jgi:hypothetical protein
MKSEIKILKHLKNIVQNQRIENRRRLFGYSCSNNEIWTGVKRYAH